MKRLGLLSALGVAAAACGQAGTLDPSPGRLVWAQALASPNPDELLAFAVEPSGDTVVVGTFSGRLRVGTTTITGSEARDIFFVRLDRDGTPVRARAIGPASVAVLRGSGRPAARSWLGGAFFGEQLPWPGTELLSRGGAEGFALRVGPDGAAEAAVTFGGTGPQFVSDVAADPDGGVWVAGRFAGRLDGPRGSTVTSTGGTDAFVARLTAEGRPVVLRSFGGPGEESATSVARTTDGGAVVAALYSAPFTWGDVTLEAPDVRRGLLSGLARTGEVRWVTPIGEAAEILSIAATSDGGAVVAGHLRADSSIGDVRLSGIDGIDPFVACVDATGAVRAARRFGGNEIDLVRAVAVDGGGAVWLTGTFQSDLRFGATELVAEGGRDLYVARLDPDLSVRWVEQYGAPAGDQVAAGLVIAPDETAVVATGFGVALDAGRGPVPSAGALDILIMKVRP